MKKFLSSVAAAVLVLAGVTFGASAANATEVCVPSEAWSETVVVTPAVAAVPAIPAVPEVLEVSHFDYQRYSWTGGPTDVAPTEVPPSENWKANTKDYEGAGHGSAPVGVAFQGNGNSDWFFWTSTTVIDQPYVAGVPEVPGTPEVPAVTKLVEHPAVTCPPVDEEPEEPTTYTPSCTTVTDSATLTGTGVISVPGGWTSNTIAVPFTGTLSDIGTVLDIQATPLQYVGLHIQTAEGSIVFEEEASYSGKLWSNSSWDGVEAGLGYPAFGTIEEFIELNGDVAVTGIDLLYTHPEASTTTVTSFTIGCTVYTFVPEVVVPEKPADIVTSETNAVLDCENDKIAFVTKVTTIGHVYREESNSWVKDKPVFEYSEEVVEATDAECPPPVVEEPEEPVVEEEEEVIVTPAAARYESLPETGGDFNPILPIGGGILLLGGLTTVLWRRFAHN